jgi:hypothetical protein
LSVQGVRFGRRVLEPVNAGFEGVYELRYEVVYGGRGSGAASMVLPGPS